MERCAGVEAVSPGANFFHYGGTPVRAHPVGAAPGADEFEQARAAVADIWANLLGHRTFAMDTNFFEIGGDSLLLAKALGPVNALGEPGGEPIQLIDLFDDATVDGIAACVVRRGAREGER